MSTAMYRSRSSAHLRMQGRFLCLDFSRLPKQPCGNLGFLPSLGVCHCQVWRGSGLCCNEEVEKVLNEIHHDAHHNRADSLWIVMLVRGQLGRNNAGNRAARASASSSWSSTFSSGQVSTEKLCDAVQESQGVSSRFRRQPPPTVRQEWPKIRRRCQAQWSESKSLSCSGETSNCSSLPK